MQINLGSIYDSVETLKLMCHDKSNELVNSIHLEDGEEREIVFWTNDIPELIGVSKINKNESGILVYHLDFKSSTLF